MAHQATSGPLYGTRRSTGRVDVADPDPLRPRGTSLILNRMVQRSKIGLDASFAALADPTRRAVLARLAEADASVGDLAEGCGLTLTGMKKHLAVLERAGLVETEKVGRVRVCRLGPRPQAEEAAWIAGHRRLWAARFDALQRVVDQLVQEGESDADGS